MRSPSRAAALTQDEQPQRRRNHELGELRSALPNLDRPLARQGTQQLGHIQRVASGALDGLEERRPRGCSHDLSDQGGHLVGIHASQAQVGTSLGQELSQEPIQLRAPGRGPEGPNQGERQVGKAPAQLAKAEKGRRISPVKVLHHQNHWRRQAHPLHQRQHRFQDPEPERRRIGQCQGTAPNRFAVSDEQAADLRSLRVRRSRVKIEGLHQRPEGPVALQLRRRPDIGLEPKSSSAAQDFGHKPRLADPSLALDEADLARALGGSAEQLVQRGDLRGAAHKGPGPRRRGRHRRRPWVGVSLGG
jgi:hypothetical protein